MRYLFVLGCLCAFTIHTSIGAHSEHHTTVSLEHQGEQPSAIQEVNLDQNLVQLQSRRDYQDPYNRAYQSSSSDPTYLKDRDNDDDNHDDDDFDDNRRDSRSYGQIRSPVVNRPYNGSSNNAAPATIVDNTAPRQVELTLSILKPDAVKNRHIGDIISRFEDKGLRIVAMKMVRLNKDEAAQFYKVHRDRPFFRNLVDFMASGPVVIVVLEGEQAVNKNRQLMGATDPSKADKGTIRSDFARSISENAVHGSDSAEAARQEIQFFFKPNEIYSN